MRNTGLEEAQAQAYDQLSILKSRDITLPTKVYLVKAIYCHPAYLTYMQSKYIMRNAGLIEA